MIAWQWLVVALLLEPIVVVIFLALCISAGGEPPRRVGINPPPVTPKPNSPPPAQRDMSEEVRNQIRASWEETEEVAPDIEAYR
jgi:hypothetical protein